MAKPKEPEFESDAWERFERAVKVVTKSAPQHRMKAKPKPKRSKGQRKVSKTKPGK